MASSGDRPAARLVAGLWCSDVLERLPDYLDGSLPPTDRAAVEGHLAGCDGCTRFGGEYASVVRTLRERLAPDAPDEGVARRLAERLAKELGPAR